MTVNATPVRAAVYLRVSLDATGEGLAVDRQRKDCLRIVKQRGWTLAKEYVDNSISASDAKKARPGYDALVKGWDAGTFDALVCWDLDRLTRQPRQLEDWIDRAEDRGLVLVTANGEADLSTDGGRMFARVKAAVARSEVERKSARQKAAARQRSTMGRPPLGVRLTGYTPAGALITAEAAVVERIFKMFGAGESLHAIKRDLTAEGISTRHGRPWSPSSVRSILTNPRYAGRVVYQGKETGQKGSWEAIVDDDTFNLVQARLNDPRRKTARHGTDRKHLGSGIYLCDQCRLPVRAWSGNRYRCQDGCLIRSMAPIDKLVVAVITERLRRPDAADLLTAHEADAAPVVSEVNRLRKRLEAIGADYDGGLIDGARFAVATEKVKADLIAAERQLAAFEVGPQLSAENPAEAFQEVSLMGKRAVVSALCTVRLKKGTRGSRTFDPETVVIEWKGGK